MTVTKYAEITELAATAALDVLGGFHPDAQDKTPEGCKTLLLLGPGPGFWPHINAAPEMTDAGKDPIDRWSTRVIGDLANRLGGVARYPFGGPPYEPFYTWALRTGRIWSSPVKLVVHDTNGLFVSFRGALLLPYRIDLPARPTAPPCETCSKPCLTACPVDALTGDGYALDRCHSYLNTQEGKACMTRGCAVRRACPAGQSLRDPGQSAYHMSVFHRDDTALT